MHKHSRWISSAFFGRAPHSFATRSRLRGLTSCRLRAFSLLFFVIGSRISSALWYHSSFLSRRVAGLVSYRYSLFRVMYLALWPRFLPVMCLHFVGFCYRVTPCLTLSCLGQFCASVTCSLRYLFCYAQGHGNLPTPLSRAEFFGYYSFELKFYLRTVSLCAVFVCVISKGSTFLRLFSLPFQPPPRFTQCAL